MTGRRNDLWEALAAPGVLWLALFFLVPFYVILAVAFGTVDPILQTPAPAWSPLDWDTSAFSFVLNGLFSSGGAFQVVFLRTLAYVGVAVALSLVIAYPVAYTIARFGGRYKGLLLVALVAPFFISYLMRMLAWINLLQADGWVNDVLVWLQVLDEPRNWLDGRASSVILGLVYGYVPFMILPLYAFLDRIDRNLLEAARDLGASPFHAFRLVTLPLSVPAILAGVVIVALPMFGDYYTPDLLSGSPSTTIVGNQITLYIRGGGWPAATGGRGARRRADADACRPDGLLPRGHDPGRAEAARMRARARMRRPVSAPRFTCTVGAGRDSGRFRIVAIPNLLSQIRDLRDWQCCRDRGSASADSGSAGLA